MEAQGQQSSSGPSSDRPAIEGEKQHQQFLESIRDFHKTELKHATTDEKVVLPDKTIIAQEKTVEGISHFDKGSLKHTETSEKHNLPDSSTEQKSPATLHDKAWKPLSGAPDKPWKPPGALPTGQPEKSSAQKPATTPSPSKPTIQPFTQKSPAQQFAQKSVAQQKPVVAQQKPVVAQQKPVVAQQKPVVAQQKPVVAQQKPVVAQQKPVSQPQPAAQKSPAQQFAQKPVAQQKPVPQQPAAQKSPAALEKPYAQITPEEAMKRALGGRTDPATTGPAKVAPPQPPKGFVRPTEKALGTTDPDKMETTESAAATDKPTNSDEGEEGQNLPEITNKNPVALLNEKKKTEQKSPATLHDKAWKPLSGAPDKPWKPPGALPTGQPEKSSAQKPATTPSPSKPTIQPFTQKSPAQQFAQKSVAQQKPVVAQQKPVVAQQKPVVAQQKPVVAQQKPVVAQQKPVVAQQKPVSQPQPAAQKSPAQQFAQKPVAQQKPVPQQPAAQKSPAALEKPYAQITPEEAMKRALGGRTDPATTGPAKVAPPQPPKGFVRPTEKALGTTDPDKMETTESAAATDKPTNSDEGEEGQNLPEITNKNPVALLNEKKKKMQNYGRGQPGRGPPNRGHHGGRGGQPDSDRNYHPNSRSEGYIDEDRIDQFRGRGGYMDMPRGRGCAMDTHRGRGGAMDTHMGRGGAMDTHRGRGGAMDTHRGRGGAMDTHRGRGGSMDMYRGRGGSMDNYRGRGGSMDNYRGSGGSMDNYRGRGACMESYRGRGDFADNYRGRGGSVDNPRGRGGSLQRGRGGMQRGRGSYSNMDQEYMPGPMAAQMAQPPMGPYTTQPPLMMQPPPMAPYMTQPPVAQQMNQPQMVPYMTQSQQIMQPPMASYMTQTPVAQLTNQPQMGPYMTQPPIPPLMTQPSNRRNMDRGRRRQYANQRGGQRMNVKGNVEGRSMTENGRGRYNYRKVPGAHKRGNPASRRRGNLKVFDDTASETSSVVSYVSSVDSEEDVDNLSEDLKEVRRENRGPYRRFGDRRYNFSGRSFRGGRAINRQRGKSGYVVACSPSRETKDDNDGYTTSSVESAEDSDNSEISIESETSVGEKTNPVLAGTDGLDTLSIKTMRNRIFRYKRKLAELRKKPIPDLVQINELEDVVAEINAKVNLRMEEERKITERKNRGTKNYDSKHKRKSGERNNNPRKTKGVEDDYQYNKDNEEPENISSEGTVISESENEAIKEKIKPRKKTHTTIIAKKGITSFKPNSKTRVINKSGKLPKNTGVIEKIKEAWDEENKSDFGESKDNSERKYAVKQKIRTKTTAKDTVTDTVTDDAMEHKEKKTDSDKSRNRSDRKSARKREITNQNNAKDAVKEVKDDGLEIEGTNSDCNESTHSSDKKPTARKNKIKKRNNKDDTHIEDDSKEIEKLFSTLDDLCASTPNKLPDQKPTSSAQGTGNQRKQSLNAKQLSEVTTSPVSSIHSISDAHTIGKPVRVTNRRESEGSNPDTRNYSKNGPNDIDVFKFLVLEMHSVGTIDDIKAKSQLFQDVDAYEWFRHNNRRFTLLERDGKITTVFGLVRDTSYCLSYITIRSCKESNCKHYHICKNLLSGKCTFGENCKFSHNVFDDRNIAVTKRLGLDNVFNNEQIVALLSVRYPRVCDNWNEPDSCPDSLCTNLHLCKLHVQRNCLNGEQCKLEHLHSTNHNKPIVAAYRMERLNDIMFHKLIFLQKLGTLEERQNPEKSARADDKKGDDPVSNVKSVESSVSVADDGPAGKAQIRQDSRAVPKPLHTRPNRQKVGETTNNDDLKLVADSASETFICEQQFLTGRCSNRGCRLLHSNGLRLPYIWQVKLYDAWTSVDDSCVVESSFSDPRIRSSQVTMVDKHGTSQTVTINFDDDGRFFAQCALGELPTRRLSTKSYGSLKVQPSSFLTRWVWYWLDDDGGWRPFDTDTLQYTLESKYQFGQETFLYSRDNYRFKYSLDFTTMKQFNIDTRKARTVTRRPTYVSVDDVHKGTLPSISIPRAPAPLPATWATWDLSHPFELVELNMDDADYITVEKSFYTTLRREEEVIDHIYRVQCASLWSKLESHRKSMVAAAERAGRGSAIDERKLFHGTDSLDVVRGICINNFDPRMSGKNATRYGEGAYFHKNAKYSHAYTGNNPAERFMFQTIVLIGDFVLGDPAYRRPPARPGAAHELFDSCVDRMSDPTIFVAFDRDQQYPEYLIQYHDDQQPEGPVVEERPAPPRPTTKPSTGVVSYPSVGAMSYPS